ncbi:FAD-dependent oxidoreductase [Amycolatopsis pithecellobii]|uniref:FAD-dependent oxidoreductase n=1 Tax=Amycolatopsis pithecellobii TaxID=664692 RepID=A0A6N7Z154_9PSEU|nr:FAD-dependent oxidoreductase [Amycolatopsis pithecellobii]MTD54489.1 FAD-dependent oxidoreductase [Amycolatopsis pithecellobii]
MSALPRLSTENTVSVPSVELPMTTHADVVVAGGGPAGFCAAIGASRAGARVVLVERGPFLGGTATGAMVASFMGFYWREVLVGGGVGHEITQRLIEAGGATEFTPYVLAEASENPLRVRTFPFDPEILKLVLDDLATEAGIEVLLHSQATSPVLHDGKVHGLVVQGRYAAEAIGAPVVVDATADAVVSRKSGCGTENSLDERRDRQPMTMMARLSNVDVGRFRALDRAEKRRLARLGVETGQLAQQLLSLLSSPSGNDAFILMTRVTGLDGSDSHDLTRAEIAGRAQLRSVISFLREAVPGFESAYLSSIAPWIGVRETWRIAGDYVLTESDVLAGHQFPDAIAQAGGPLDVHDNKTGLTLLEPPAPFSVPYRSLLPKGVDGLLVAGRCLSATQAAMGAVRHMGTAMATGQAAGVAAALAAQLGVAPRAVPPERIRAVLRTQGAIVDPPAAVAPSLSRNPDPEVNDDQSRFTHHG